MKVLNIDDSTVNNMLMENLLSSFGYETYSMLEGTDVLEKIEEYQPDVIILDMMMPQRSGLDVLEDIRAKGIHIPVIVITAMKDKTLKQKAMRLGVADYQTKPVKMATLKASIEHALKA
jgi:two-component system response regulator VicR